MSEKTEVVALLNRTTVGFWLYLMTDCILFASLFATYVVLRGETAGGPSGHEIFEMPTALAETIILLTSSFTSGMALIAMKQKNIRQLYVALAATYLLGVSFLTIEISEFSKFVAEGHGWQQSAFLSSFFTLVGTHGLHILTGLIWLLVLVTVLARKGLTDKLVRQMTLFGLFWHFLDLVWIFIFTVVYLIGVAT
ncbi:MAG: cytochrome o ubiquinol oxidase subunit III [Candidatus Nomurabacteria bacterium]|nr:MAG: cytochrome o ubiquinol oxidase subunit III [Candidatus Nomurabacteria bacterium]